MEEGAIICCIFDKQGPILAQVGRDIRRQASQGTLWRTEEEILWSLSHMRCNRLLGTRRQREQEAYAAWYATLKVRYHLVPSPGTFIGKFSFIIVSIF